METTTATLFYINGTKVTEDKFETEVNDNSNLSIESEITVDTHGNYHLTYDDIYGDGVK